mmetsp:Transcript_7292/g.8346  ORF Transcript_7292/g.8346 Transcript_7292/m.8346 type:complete len:91 (+) Transcript_7292:1158-1430(+)
MSNDTTYIIQPLILFEMNNKNKMKKRERDLSASLTTIPPPPHHNLHIHIICTNVPSRIQSSTYTSTPTPREERKKFFSSPLLFLKRKKNQ